MLLGNTLIKPLFKLDLGCGPHKEDGYVGVDITQVGTKADIQHDLLQFPWPFEDSSVDELFSSHFFEHVPNLRYGRLIVLYFCNISHYRHRPYNER